jgi:hypothetical protein
MEGSANLPNAVFLPKSILRHNIDYFFGKGRFFRKNLKKEVFLAKLWVKQDGRAI